VSQGRAGVELRLRPSETAADAGEDRNGALLADPPGRARPIEPEAVER